VTEPVPGLNRGRYLNVADLYGNRNYLFNAFAMDKNRGVHWKQAFILSAYMSQKLKNRNNAVASVLSLSEHSKLLQRMAKHRELLSFIKAALPSPVDTHCLDCSINDKGCLLVYCENAAWAFNLRFYAEHILSGVRAQGERANSVRFRVLAPSLEKLDRHTRRLDFNRNSAAEALSVVADTMPQHKLGLSLHRLALTILSTKNAG